MHYTMQKALLMSSAAGAGPALAGGVNAQHPGCVIHVISGFGTRLASLQRADKAVCGFGVAWPLLINVHSGTGVATACRRGGGQIFPSGVASSMGVPCLA
jgi:hypothetical protein